MFFKQNNPSLPMLSRTKKIMTNDKYAIKYAQTRTVYKKIGKALDNEQGDKSTLKLNTRMVNNDYAVPILNSLDNLFYYEDKFFTPTKEQELDVNMRQNAQKCLKILFDYTNLSYEDIFTMLTDEQKSEMFWIKEEKVDLEKDAISIACSALGLDKIFKKGRFQGLKSKIEKLKHLDKSYEQKATLFSRLVECNKDLQKMIFSALGTLPCRYSEKFNTRFEAKQAERKQKIKKIVQSPQADVSLAM